MNIVLPHNKWMNFLAESYNPNLEALKKRDGFIEKANKDCPLWYEGNELVANIILGKIVGE